MTLQITWGEWTIFTRLSYIYPIKQGCFPITMILINNNFVSGKKKKKPCHKNQIIFLNVPSPLFLFVPYIFCSFSLLSFSPHLWNVCIYVYAYLYIHTGTSLVAQMVKNLLAVQEMWLDPWIKKIPWRRECYPLQYFCLENSTDRGAWQTTVYGITKSWTQLSD